MRISVKVITKAKKQEILKVSDKSYRVKVIGVPERGKANKELVQILSEYFRVSKSSVRIVNGELSSNKIIEIANK